MEEKLRDGAQRNCKNDEGIELAQDHAQ